MFSSSFSLFTRPSSSPSCIPTLYSPSNSLSRRPGHRHSKSRPSLSLLKTPAKLLRGIRSKLMHLSSSPPPSLPPSPIPSLSIKSSPCHQHLFLVPQPHLSSTPSYLFTSSRSPSLCFTSSWVCQTSVSATVPLLSSPPASSDLGLLTSSKKFAIFSDCQFAALSPFSPLS